MNKYNSIKTDTEIQIKQWSPEGRSVRGEPKQVKGINRYKQLTISDKDVQHRDYSLLMSL